MSEDSDFSNDWDNWDNINEEDWDETIKTILSYDLNCKEIEWLKTVFHKKHIIDENYIQILLYFPTTILIDNGLNQEMLKAWGLSDIKCLGIKFDIINNIIEEKSVTIGQIDYQELDKDINEIEILNTIFSWILRDMVKNIIRRTILPDRNYKIKEVSKLIEIFKLPIPKAISLLEKDSYTKVESKLLEGFKCPRESEIESIEQLSKNNIFILIVNKVKNRIINACSLCLICSNEVENSGMKPIICNTILCQTKYYDLGLGYSLDTEITMNEKTLDLQITLAYSAFMSTSKTLDFISLREGVTKESIKECMSVCPTISEMKTMISTSSLRKELNFINSNLYGFIAWLMATNSAHIRPLTNEEMIPQLNNTNQFVLLSSTPEKEARFRELKQQNKGKSIWAFHGSSITNWFTIIRTGLKILSGTQYMTSGSAHGIGLYFATNSGTSLGYSQKFITSNHYKSKLGNHPVCVALCEIVPPKDLYRSGDFIVLRENEDRVVTRFLLIGDTIPNVSIHQIEKEIPEIV